jgi:hypothetical protein
MCAKNVGEKNEPEGSWRPLSRAKRYLTPCRKCLEYWGNTKRLDSSTAKLGKLT